MSGPGATVIDFDLALGESEKLGRSTDELLGTSILIFGCEPFFKEDDDVVGTVSAEASSLTVVAVKYQHKLNNFDKIETLTRYV